MIGTIAIDTGDGVLPAVHTTPEAYEIQKYLAQMVDNGCDTCVMEVSSQGLKMQRVEGIFFDIGMFLNIISGRASMLRLRNICSARAA